MGLIELYRTKKNATDAATAAGLDRFTAENNHDAFRHAVAVALIRHEAGYGVASKAVSLMNIVERATSAAGKRTDESGRIDVFNNTYALEELTKDSPDLATSIDRIAADLASEHGKLKFRVGSRPVFSKDDVAKVKDLLTWRGHDIHRQDTNWGDISKWAPGVSIPYQPNPPKTDQPPSQSNDAPEEPKGPEHSMPSANAPPVKDADVPKADPQEAQNEPQIEPDPAVEQPPPGKPFDPYEDDGAEPGSPTNDLGKTDPSLDYMPAWKEPPPLPREAYMQPTDPRITIEPVKEPKPLGLETIIYPVAPKYQQDLPAPPKPLGPETIVKTTDPRYDHNHPAPKPLPPLGPETYTTPLPGSDLNFPRINPLDIKTEVYDATKDDTEEYNPDPGSSWTEETLLMVIAQVVEPDQGAGWGTSYRDPVPMLSALYPGLDIRMHGLFGVGINGHVIEPLFDKHVVLSTAYIEDDSYRMNALLIIKSVLDKQSW